MRRYSLPLFILSLLLITSMAATDNIIVDNEGYRLSVIQSDLRGLTLSLELKDFTLANLNSGGEVFTRIELPGAGIGFKPGAPRLPVISRPFILPDGLGAVVSVKHAETEYMDNILPEPCREEPSTPFDAFAKPFPDEDIYSGAEAFPLQAVTISSPVIARDLRFASLDISPFRFHPSQRRLEIFRRLEIEVEFVPGGENPKTREKPHISQASNQKYLPAMLNPGIIDELDENPGIGAYLFIIPSPEYADEIERLVDWKHEQGYEVTVADLSETGSTAEEIKTYIQEAYDTWDIPPEYVILAGDVDGDAAIPCFYYDCGGGEMAPTDHEYSLLEGDDYFSDLSVGRLSVRDETQLFQVVYKILRYEMKPFVGGIDWFSRGLMLADNNALSAVTVKQWSRQIMLDWGCSQVDTIFFYGNLSATTVAYYIDYGLGIINFRGYLGWGGWSNTNVQSLGNSSMNPLVFGCSPGTNTFDDTECLGESWLRTGEVGDPRGGIACIGPSSANTWSSWDGTLDQGFMWALYEEGLYDLGDVIDRGKLELWLNFPWNREPGGVTNSVECYYHIYETLGDPGMSVWKEMPRAVFARYRRTIALGQNFVELLVTDANGPLEGGRITLAKDDEVLCVAYSDENGYANLQVSPQTPGNISVTITGSDLVPYRGTIEVVQQNFVALDSIAIDDDEFFPSQGNGNGLPNPGETIEIHTTMVNISPVPVYGVTITISSPDTSVQMIVAQLDFGNFSPGQSITGSFPYVAQISSEAPHGLTVPLEIDAEDENGVHYFSQYLLQITAPSPQFVSYSLPEAVLDTALYPGESSSLYITLLNQGGETGEIDAILSCSLDGVTVEDSVGMFAAAGAGELFTNSLDPFYVSTGTEVFPGMLAPMTLILTAESGWSGEIYFDLYIGPPEVYDPIAPVEGCEYFCFDSWDVAYSQMPVYQWLEIDPDYGGSGTYINLEDPQPNMGDSEIIDLPPGFQFQYCGEVFDRITVGSDGWISCGETGFRDFRNRPIPSSNEPPGMIAVFWDDLLLIDDGGVYYEYVGSLQCFVVEWSRAIHAQNSASEETFELILWDAAAYPTSTGDSPITFQYNTINDIGSASNWSTVGLLNPNCEQGMQYVYSNIYSLGAKELGNDMALYFTSEQGTQMIPPTLLYSPASFQFYLAGGQMETQQLLIRNIGEVALSYTIKTSPLLLDLSGGPDDFGYIWIDSDEPGGPEFNWIDISELGTEIIFPHNDSTSANLPMGFSFPYYNQFFPSLIVSANGWLSFTSHSNAWNNTPLPSTSAPENLISGYWDDLDPLAGDGQVFVWGNGADSSVVSFIEVEHWGSTPGIYTYQYILSPNGDITLQYLRMEGNTTSATIGMQNADRDDGFTICYNESYVHDSLRIDILRPWLFLDTESGIIAPGGGDTVNVTARSENRTPGIYQQNIVLYTNDPTHYTVTIPVEMNISGVEGIACSMNVGLSISRMSYGFLLNWTAIQGIESFRIYRSDEPHFDIDSALLLGVTGGTSFLDETAGGGVSWYYRVVWE